MNLKIYNGSYWLLFFFFFEYMNNIYRQVHTNTDLTNTLRPPLQ